MNPRPSPSPKFLSFAPLARRQVLTPTLFAQSANCQTGSEFTATAAPILVLELVVHSGSVSNSVSATDASPATSSQRHTISDSEGASYDCRIASANKVLKATSKCPRHVERDHLLG
jgi:hypothetical protein